jgi:hypothetical protein
MTLSPTVQKICCACGQDVAGQKRTKDDRGNYYCAPCWIAKARATRAAGRNAPVQPRRVPQSVDDDYLYVAAPELVPEQPPVRPPPVPKLAVSNVEDGAYQMAEWAPVQTPMRPALRLQTKIVDISGVHRDKASSTAMTISRIGFLLSVLVPAAWCCLVLYALRVPLTARAIRLAAELFAGYAIFGGIYWVLGNALDGRGIITPIIAMILSSLVTLAHDAIPLLVAIWTLLRGGPVWMLGVLAVSLILLLLHVKLIYHSLRILLGSGRPAS